MRIALDTDRYVDLCKGAAETVELLETATKVVVPFAVLGELRAGFLVSRRQVENERRQLRKQGTPIPTNDMWLAALVLSTTSPCTRETSTSSTYRNSYAGETQAGTGHAQNVEPRAHSRNNWVTRFS